MAGSLAANESMRQSIREFAAAGGPVYAECGGLMYLVESIRTVDGAVHEMVGLLDGRCIMYEKLRALGYVEVETQDRTVLGPTGLRFRGHQFRYSDLDPEPVEAERVYSVRRRRGGQTSPEGYRKGSVLASYVHGHWASNPRVAEGFVESCAAWRSARAR